MKILHINCNYLYSQLHQQLMRYLIKHGCDGNVFSPIVKGANIRVDPDDYVYYSECFNSYDRILFYHKQNKIINEVKKYVEIKKYDCIHAYTLFTDGNCAMRLAEIYGKPYVVAVRDTDVNTFLVKKPYLKARAVNILKKAKAVFFLSQPYFELMINKYIPDGLKQEISDKSFIIPNGIDDFWHENVYRDRDMSKTEKKIADKQLHVIFVGAISKRKNASSTVQALKLLQKRGWKVKFTVVGAKEDENEYSILSKSGFTDLVGQQSKEIVLEFMRKADVFVMPSRTETFGLTYAEALSQGLPVIYSKGQGFDGQFEEGKVGYSVIAEDCTDIADKIEKVCSNYKAISNNAINLFEKFNWNAISQKYIQIYESIIDVSMGK